MSRSVVPVVAGLVAGLTVASCGIFDVDDSSVTAMISTFRADQAPLGQYFSFDRYEDGSGVDLSGADTQVLQEVFVERSADPTVWQPFIEATNSLWPERWSIAVSSVDATYEQPATPGATLMHGRFETDGLETRLNNALPDPPADVDGDPAAPALATEVSVERDGEFTLLSFDGLVPPGLGIDDRTSLAVSEDRMVVLPRGATASGALVEDREGSQLHSRAVRQVAGALDEAEVYAAVISFEALTFDDGEPALAGGFGTGFADGGERSSTVLAHDTDAAATHNAQAVVPLMNVAAGCIDPPEVKVQGRVVIASCRSDGAKWASTVRDGFDASSPFRFE